MTETPPARFTVVSRSAKQSHGPDQHSLSLLHKPKVSRPEPWWQFPAGLEIAVHPDFEAAPGDFVDIIVKRVEA